MYISLLTNLHPRQGEVCADTDKDKKKHEDKDKRKQEGKDKDKQEDKDI